MTGGSSEGQNADISLHEVRVYVAFLDNPTAWLTNKDVAQIASVSGRTARLHTQRLTGLGILNVTKVVPGYRFQLSDMAIRQNVSYITHLDNARAVFAMPLRATVAAALDGIGGAS